MSAESDKYGPHSYYWDGKIDGIEGDTPDPDNAVDAEYMDGFRAGQAIRESKSPRT